MNPRILIITTVHHPLDARIWQRQILTLLSSGWEVTYAAPFRARGVNRSELTDIPNPENLTLLDVSRSAGRNRLRPLAQVRRLIAARGGEHSLILIHDPELLLAIGGARNVIWDVHEDTAAALVAKPWLPTPLRGAVSLAVRALERWAEKRVRLLLAEYGYSGRFTREHTVVPNAVDVPATHSEVRFEPRVVYLGTMTMERGAEEVAELACLLSPDLRVEVIGPAHGQAAEVLGAAADQGLLTWHGFVPSGEALELLPGAIAGISLLQDLPNYRHSLPTKLVEYMSRGVPVVSTPLPVATELIGRAGGIVVPFNDPHAAAGEIRDLWSDHARAHRLAQEAYTVAQRDYDWRRHGEAFERLLRGWASAGPR